MRIKATPRRLAILQVMAGQRRYLSPEEIWEAIGKQFKRLGLPTIYRNLDELARGGLISQIVRPDRRLYYFLCGNERHHHHFICVNCRRVEDLDICIAEKLGSQVKRRLGGIVKSHILQVDGLCSECGKHSRREYHENN